MILSRSCTTKYEWHLFLVVVTLFNPFKGKCFRCIVVQEIGIPSISLFSLIDQFVMLNSPLLPSTPCCRTVDGMGGIYLAEATTVSYFQQTFVWQPSIRPSFYPCVQQIKNFVNQKFSSVEGIFEKKTSPEVRYVEYLVGVQLRYLSIYCLRKRILYFQNMPLGGAFFEACQCFIPRREMRSISSRGPIVFTYVLSPEGRCVAYPVGVQLRLFPFIEFWVRRGILDFKNR